MTGVQTCALPICLKEAEEIEELSRILSGAEVTDKVKESAREMKRLANEWKETAKK